MSADRNRGAVGMARNTGLVFFPLMRIAAQLRRIARALERRNEIVEEQSRGPVPRAARKTEFSVARVEDWNDAYEERQRTGGL